MSIINSIKHLIQSEQNVLDVEYRVVTQYKDRKMKKS